MPDIQPVETTTPRRRARDMAGIDPAVRLLIEFIDGQHDDLLGEVRQFRTDAERQAVANRRLAWVAMGGFFLIQVILVFALIETRGVDTTKITDNTVKVLEAAKPAESPTPPGE